MQGAGPQVSSGWAVRLTSGSLCAFKAASTSNKNWHRQMILAGAERKLGIRTSEGGASSRPAAQKCIMVLPPNLPVFTTASVGVSLSASLCTPLMLGAQKILWTGVPIHLIFRRMMTSLNTHATCLPSDTDQWQPPFPMRHLSLDRCPAQQPARPRLPHGSCNCSLTRKAAESQYLGGSS